MEYNQHNQSDIIIKYLPIVERIAGKINTKDLGIEREDLINIGVIGLIDAIKRYDHKKQVPFEAYASLRIRGNIMDELRKNGEVSRNRIEKLNQYYAAKEELKNELLREPKESEICEKMNISEHELFVIYETVHCLSSTSLDSVIFSDEGNEIRLIDVLKDDKSLTPEEQFVKDESKKILYEAIGTLEHREKLVLNFYYVENLTLKEIAYILDVSIPRVSQIHGRILAKLRSIIKNTM